MEPRANISKENHNRPRDLITKDKLSYSSLDDINPRAFLTRAQAAEALEACGVKVSQATLASKATLRRRTEIPRDNVQEYRRRPDNATVANIYQAIRPKQSELC